MAILGKALGLAFKMTPKRKAALAKAVKASAAIRKKGTSAVVKKGSAKIVKTKAAKAVKKIAAKPIKKISKATKLKAAKKPPPRITAKQKLNKKRKSVLAKASKYEDKAQRKERNIQGSILNRESNINLARRIQLGHYARKTRRLIRQASRIT